MTTMTHHDAAVSIATTPATDIMAPKSDIKLFITCMGLKEASCWARCMES